MAAAGAATGAGAGAGAGATTAALLAALLAAVARAGLPLFVPVERWGDATAIGERTADLGIPVVLVGAHYVHIADDLAAAERWPHLLLDTSRLAHFAAIETAVARIGHEARVSKVSDEQIFYLMSRGLSEDQALMMVVSGFIEPFTKELPMEYAVEMNRLIELEMEGSVG